MIRLVGVSPREALPVVELVERASREVTVERFDLVVVKGGEDLREVLGEYWTPESSDFYALHIALEGPTVVVRLDVPRDLLTASVYHELGHAKLHGHRRYYEISVPRDDLPLGNAAPKVLYLLSIAVKDYEVSRYLAERGLAHTQWPLMKEMLPLEPLPWEELRRNKLTSAMALAAQLKGILFSLPLLGEDLVRDISGAPEELLEWAIEMTKKLGRDTIQNVRLVARFFYHFLSSFVR
ncbi:MAG: hypothetical protein QI199_02115 [Candidatus Korarchaeota archaeon]|nr:hypothetical protein [Candidatus Korarchaeota archaeon]